MGALLRNETITLDENEISLNLSADTIEINGNVNMDEPPPVWLQNALKANASDAEQSSNPAFQSRCDIAVQTALTLSLLRAQRGRIGFVPLSLADYVQDMAMVMGRSLQPVLNWLGIADIETVDRETAPALGKLARELGFSLREALAIINISYAEKVGTPATALAVSYRDSNGKSVISECEDVLQEIVTLYPADTMQELGAIEVSVRNAYGKEEGV